MINLFFGTLATMVSLTLIVAGYLNAKAFTNSPTWVKKACSWAVPVILAFVGYGKNIGIFEGATVLQTALYGIAAGLTANGVFDLEFVQQLLEFIGARKPKKS